MPGKVSMIAKDVVSYDLTTLKPDDEGSMDQARTQFENRGSQVFTSGSHLFSADWIVDLSFGFNEL